MTRMRTSIIVVTIASGLAAIGYGTLAAQDAKEKQFPPSLTIKAKAEVNEPGPEYGYLSPTGAFALKRDSGRAIFAYFFDQDEEVHDHKLVYKGTAVASDGDKYWVYADPAEKPLLEFLFAQKAVSSQGYRIYLNIDGTYSLFSKDATRAKISKR
jgi:hypothetical protein